MLYYILAAMAGVGIAFAGAHFKLFVQNLDAPVPKEEEEQHTEDWEKIKQKIDYYPSDSPFFHGDADNVVEAGSGAIFPVTHLAEQYRTADNIVYFRVGRTVYKVAAHRLVFDGEGTFHIK